MKKKVVSALLLSAVALSMAACGGSGSDTASTTAAEAAGTETGETSAPETAAAGEALKEYGEIPEDVDREQTLTFAQGAAWTRRSWTTESLPSPSCRCMRAF